MDGLPNDGDERRACLPDTSVSGHSRHPERETIREADVMELPALLGPVAPDCERRRRKMHRERDGARSRAVALGRRCGWHGR